MGMLNDYANAAAVNAALNKGVEANKAVSELKSDLSELIEGNFDTTGNLIGFNRMFELGNISVTSSGFAYYNSTSRVRIKKDTAVSLKAGDKITIGSNIAVYIGCLSNGEYTGVGWYTNQTRTLDKTGEYVFILRYPTEATISDFNAVVSDISVYRPSNSIDVLSNDVDILKDKTQAIYNSMENEVSLLWSQGTGGTDTNPNRINAKIGYIKSTLELTPNATLKTSVKVYSDSSYTNLISDSGWKTDIHKQSVDGYIQLLSMSRTEEAAITPTSATGIVLKVLTNLPLLEQKVLQNEDNINKNTENIGNLNQVIVNNWLQSLPTGVYAGNRISQRLGYIKGSVTITDAGGIRIAVHTYTDSTYQTKVTDSNWKTTGYSENVDGYVALVACAMDWGSDLTPNNGANAIITKVENITKRLADMQTTIDDSIKTVSSVWSYGSENSFKAIAHQGGKGVVPPCTLPAVLFAKKQGFRAVENDLRRTSDGVWVMWHDDNFKVIGHEEITVETSTYADLQLLDVGSYISPQFENTRVATFKEWLTLCRELGLEPWIDSKQIINETYANEIFNIVKKLGMARNVVWVGYTHKVKQYADQYATVAILANPTEDVVSQYSSFISTGENPKCSFDVQITGLTDERIELAYNNGFDIGAWWDNSYTMSESEVLATIKPWIAKGMQYITLNNVNVEKLLCNSYGME